MFYSNLRITPNSYLNIKSKYILKEIFKNLTQKKLLETIKYTKKIQEKLEIDIEHYKDYCGTIEINITAVKPNEDTEHYTYINFHGSKKYYHIYINGIDIETKENYYTRYDQDVKTIKIKIDKEIKSLKGIFEFCNAIETIKFVKFNRRDFTDLNGMFFWCCNLKEIDLANLKTDKITDMSRMFFKCTSLVKLNLNRFNTTNVTNMNAMFAECTSLKELFINNFNTDKVIDMTSMFAECTALKEVNISNFNLKNVKYVRWMFAKCPSELKNKIRNQNKLIKEEAF